MDAFLLSFIAGLLTVLAPCVLPLIPFFVSGRTLSSSLILVLGLGVSIFFFTLFIRAGSSIFTIPETVWQQFSMVIIFLFGCTLLFPKVWEKISFALGFLSHSQKIMNSTSQKGGLWGRFLFGSSLAPVFSSCSPTYFLILGTVLPTSFELGLVHLFLYILGVVLVFSLIAIGGHSLVKKISFFADPKGWFKKMLGILFILLAIAMFFKLDKQLEGWLLDQSWYWNAAEIEYSISEAL